MYCTRACAVYTLKQRTNNVQNGVKTMNNKSLGYWPPALAAILASALAVPCLAASLAPSWLEVRLSDRQNGKPIADAAVCLGTSARTDQFGARRSDSQGVVRFDEVSPHPLVLTVSGEGYQGRRQALEPLYESRVLAVKLVTGGGGPACDAPPQVSSAAAGSGLTVEAVGIRDNINTSPGGVLVAAQVSGPVNQIRISEQADFADAGWQPYQPVVPFTLSGGHGPKQLYVQVRRVAQVQGASIEVVSPVKKISYRQN